MRRLGHLFVFLVACSASPSLGTNGDRGRGADAETATGADSQSGGRERSVGGPSARDWKSFPAIVDAPATPTLYALSDVHGGYDRLAALLTSNHVLSKAPSSSTDAHWGAGNATLVVTGDMIDKGPSSVEVLDFLMALQADAKKSGGRVIVTLGNHEAEFLVDPLNSKASGSAGIDGELATKGVMPSAVTSGSDPRGAWLRVLPFGARVGSWFFSHAGDTQGRTTTVLEATLEAAVNAHADYNDPEIVGPTSILESRSWYLDAATAAQNAAALGVKHIAFGHDPSALGPKGMIAVSPDHILLRVDCGMSPGVDYSTGMMLRVTQQGTKDVVEELNATGQAKALFTSAR